MTNNLFIKKGLEKGNNIGVWYFLGCIVSFGLGQILGSIPLFVLIILQGDIAAFDSKSLLNPETYDINKSLFLMVLLFPFLLGTILLWLYMKVVHKRPFITLITPFKKINWRLLGGGSFIWFLILAASEGIGFIMYPENYEFRFEWGTFIPLLLVSLTFLFVQTSFEELLFRGYFMQWMGKYFQSAWWPLIITSVVFGLFHSFNPEMTEYGWSVMIMYITMGFTLGYVTLMSRSLELALGMHFANNFFTSVFINFDESALQTDSIFRVIHMEVSTIQHIVSLLSMVLYIILVKYIFKLDFNIDREQSLTPQVDL